MPLTIRPYEAADRDAVWTAVTRIYGDGMPVAPDRELPKGRLHMVAMDGPECAGIYAELSFDTLRGAAAIPTGGLAMVGVVPERRHTGLGGKLMRFALHDMWERGIQLASLYPFSESYYRQYGYELCGGRYNIACQTRFLPKLKIELPVERLAPGDFARISPCYAAFAHGRSGLTNRPDYMWERLLGRSSKSVEPLYEKTVYVAGDPAEAYVVLKHDVAFHVEQEILELAWSTARGYESILGFMRSLAANKSGLSWWEPTDSPFLSRYMVSSPLTTVKLDKLLMFRVLDVPGVIQSLKSEGSVEFTFRVDDPEIAENRGPWRVSSSDGAVTVEPATSADIEFDIRSFTQVYLGQPSIDDVLRNGLATAKNPAAVDSFRKLMPPTPVYCLDLF